MLFILSTFVFSKLEFVVFTSTKSLFNSLRISVSHYQVTWVELRIIDA